MNYLEIVEKFGLPLVFLALTIIAIRGLWKELRKKDTEYAMELKELHKQIKDKDDKTAGIVDKMTDTINTLISVIRNNKEDG